MNKITAAVASLCLGASSASMAGMPPEPNLSQSTYKQCLNRLASSKQFRGISKDVFWGYVPDVPDASVIPLLNYQPEFTKPVWDYMSGLVDRERIVDGLKAKQQWASTLSSIERRYGVKAEDVLGVWGVESNFGQTLGKRDIVESLATLSCFDRRQTYFRGELAAALKIIQAGHVNPSKMTGSWAGAFGQTQFMPSTFLRLAQDGDGDGRKDIIDSVPDALASTANFLKKAGYRTGEPWGYEVKLPDGFWAASNRKNKQPMSYWRSKGLRLADGRPLPSSPSKAGLLIPAEGGPAFLVGKNFDTFYSYNASEKYALAIAKISEQIEKNDLSPYFTTPWPTDDPGISRAEAKEIQTMLLMQGYDIGEADGIIGSKTRDAIKQVQVKLGMVADGRAGQKFYRAIKGMN